MGLLRAANRAGPEVPVKPGSKVAYVVEAAHIVPGDRHENVLKGRFLAAGLRGSSRILRLELADKSVLIYEVHGDRIDLPKTAGELVVSWPTEKAYIIPI